MLKICALNESSSEADTDSEQVQGETREAQEAGLLDLYNSGLKLMLENKKQLAKDSFVKITEAPLFLSGEGSEQIQKTLRYNVHKNLGECHMETGEYEEAEDHYFQATQIDRTDVTLWWQLATAAVKLGHLYTVRGALEEGLACSPSHWPCLENLITVTFKLADNFACLCYCAKALERDSANKKAIEYKSRVYQEMPFLQDYLNDKDFVPIPVERETYYYLPPKEPPRPKLFAEIKTLSFEGLGELLLKVYDEAEGLNIMNSLDCERVLTDFHERARLREEAKITVSVQNLVSEMMDIIEFDEGEREEEVRELCDSVLDEIICDMFGVAPLTEEENIVRAVLNDMINESVEKASTRKRSVTIQSNKAKKKHFSIFDQIPEDLLEKRRSCRQNTVLPSSGDNSSDTSGTQSNFAHKQILLGYLPSSLKSSTTDILQLEKTVKLEESKPKMSAVKALENKKSWLSSEEEKEAVTRFLTSKDNVGHPVDLMRFFMKLVISLEVEHCLPREVVELMARLYRSWRQHWGYQLEFYKPEEELTQDCVRYYILGNECLVSSCQESSAQLEESLRLQMWADLLELDSIYFHLPLDLQVRVRSLRFHYFTLTSNEEELRWEMKAIEEFYEIWGCDNNPILDHHPVSKYQVVTQQFLINYQNNVKKTKELEELQQYYNDGRFQDIVSLLSETLDKDTMAILTPSKDCNKTPDRESQIDIYIESLFHCESYEKCLRWLEVAFNTEFLKINMRVANSKMENTENEPEATEPLTEAEKNRRSKVILKSEWDILDSYLSLMESCLSSLSQESAIKFGGELSLSSAARLAQNLLAILLLQINDPSNPEVCYTSGLPWLLLHKLMLWQEKVSESQSDPQPEPHIVDLEPDLPGSISLLMAAHTYLGQKSCCTMDHGRILNYLVHVFVPIVTFSSTEKLYNLPVYSVERVKVALDQALYCLYSHPSKKSSRARHLTDHNVSQVGLTWRTATVIYNYVKPVKLPEHDDVKTLSITADTDSLLRRILALVPESIAVEKRKLIALDFLTGKSSKMKKLKKLESLPNQIRDLFYLLADYAFKSNSDMENAISYYAIDLTFNRNRFDSWAALALAQGSKLDSRLNSCHLLVPQKILAEIESVEMCYTECLRINGKNSNLWIEFGNFCYSIHSYIKRTLDNNAEIISNFEMFEKLDKKKDKFLKMSLQNYEKTLDIFEAEGLNENDVDERWLLVFMIGKIKEKQGHPIEQSLDYYQKAIGFLRKNDVVVPRKINYNNPHEFSIEALEVYYRIHASILKSIARAEGEKKIIPEETRRRYYEVIKETQMEKMFTTNSNKPKIDRFSRKRKIPRAEELANAKMTRADETSTTIMRDVVEVMDNMIDEIEFNNNTNKFSMENLAKLCLMALEDVVFHFFHHFKALYRIAHYYHNTPTKLANPVKVRQVLLAGLTDKSVPHPGLFGGRKLNMIFNEVWRIPVNEIDRPGSFASHCAKSLTLLLSVLKNIPDVSTLLDISAQLRKPPSEENKYLQESDRQDIVKMAATYLNSALKSIRDKMDVQKERKKPVETLEIFKLYQKMSKTWPGKEKEIFVHLKEMYAAIKNRTEDKDKITEAEVTKFCNSETARLRALANPKPAAVTASQTGTVGGGNQAQKVSGGAEAGKEKNPVNTNNLQQWARFLADQQKMNQFQSLLAMSGGLPNMSVQDIAQFCGLSESDIANLASYTKTIMGLSPASLAGMGITSTHLSQLVQISSLTGANQTQIGSLATKQAQFEQDYLRSFLEAGNPSTSTSKAGTTSVVKNQTKQSTTTVKQTAQFKAKAKGPGQTAATKKTVAKVLSTGPTKTSSSPSLSSVAAKLSSSGVTLTKPVAQESQQSMAKKFPFLNITPVGASSSSSTSASKPLLTVKPNSQLLKPGAGAGNKGQVNIVSTSGGASAGPPKNNPIKAPPSKQPAGDAKNKLALFKAQMKKTLNIPTVNKPKTPVSGSPSQAPRALTQTKPGPSTVKLPQSKKQDPSKPAPKPTAKPTPKPTPKPPPKPSPNPTSDKEIVCIDID